jgi:excisionase family DNA binding protein
MFIGSGRFDFACARSEGEKTRTQRDGVTDFTVLATRRKMPAADLVKFFAIEEVAGCMDVCPRTVRRWIEKGLLVAHRFNGVVRISEADFQSFLSAHRGH